MIVGNHIEDLQAEIVELKRRLEDLESKNYLLVK
jgi:hypothetical protein